MIYYGPSAPTPSYTPPIPSTGEAPAHTRFMSPRCSSLNDAIRTGPARGLRPETMATMRKDYRSECADNESEAQRAMSDERGEKAKQQRADAAAEKLERDRSKLREQQCDESKRILVTKRARTDLNDGEKAELQRFEANFRARCG